MNPKLLVGENFMTKEQQTDSQDSSNKPPSARGRRAGPRITFGSVSVTGDEAPKTHSFDVIVEGNVALTLSRQKVKVKSPDYTKLDPEFGYRTTFAVPGLESFMALDWSIGASQTKNLAAKLLRGAIREGTWIPEGWTPPPPPAPKASKKAKAAAADGDDSSNVEDEADTSVGTADVAGDPPPAQL